MSAAQIRAFAFAVTVVSLSCSGAHANWVTWELAAGGNGHRYQAVPGNEFLTWELADQLAQVQGGYLATITSAAENDFDWINGSGPAIGGVQLPGSPEPQGGWQWRSGEAWLYTNWFPGQPDNGAGGPFEDRPHYFSGFQIGVRASTWNDIAANDANLGGFVIEAVPEPAAAALLGLGTLLMRRRMNVG